MIRELDGDQIRIQTNAAQMFEAWRDADTAFQHSYKGRMVWRGPGRRYLYRDVGGVQKSLGPRSPETEKIQTDYQAQRKQYRERRNRLRAQLDKQARVNRAYRLGRMPRLAANILRELDSAGLLGTHLIVVGTHSLYAYEAAAGVHLSDDLIATTDIDLLWDARRKLKLAVLNDGGDVVLGALRNVDKSFAKLRGGFRAANDDGYLVDLIRPVEPDETRTSVRGLGGDTDLEAAAILGLQWLINAPRFAHVVIGDDGWPARVACIDPRAFALYKMWMAKDAGDREPAKRRRDQQQAKVAAVLARDYLNLPLRAKDLKALPINLVRHAKELAKAKARVTSDA